MHYVFDNVYKFSESPCIGAPLPGVTMQDLPPVGPNRTQITTKPQYTPLSCAIEALETYSDAYATYTNDGQCYAMRNDSDYHQERVWPIFEVKEDATKQHTFCFLKSKKDLLFKICLRL